MGTATGLRRLLVPLTDGADEATLQAIADVARGAGSVVRLLYVRPLPSGAASGPTLATSPGDEEKRRLEAESSRYRSEEHTSELQSQSNLVCRLLLEKKKKKV